MSSAAAHKVANEFIERRLPEDCSGRLFQIPDFRTDEECRAFFSDRDLGFHEMVNNRIARIARKRGAKITHVFVTEQDCSTGDRRAFIERCYRLL